MLGTLRATIQDEVWQKTKDSEKHHKLSYEFLFQDRYQEASRCFTVADGVAGNTSIWAVPPGNFPFSKKKFQLHSEISKQQRANLPTTTHDRTYTHIYIYIYNKKTMESDEGPRITIRKIGKDEVDFVMSDVDLA